MAGQACVVTSPRGASQQRNCQACQAPCLQAPVRAVPMHRRSTASASPGMQSARRPASRPASPGHPAAQTVQTSRRPRPRPLQGPAPRAPPPLPPPSRLRRRRRRRCRLLAPPRCHSHPLLLRPRCLLLRPRRPLLHPLPPRRLALQGGERGRGTPLLVPAHCQAQSASLLPAFAPTPSMCQNKACTESFPAQCTCPVAPLTWVWYDRHGHEGAEEAASVRVPREEVWKRGRAGPGRVGSDGAGAQAALANTRRGRARAAAGGRAGNWWARRCWTRGSNAALACEY